jgi:hypothetical protein
MSNRAHGYARYRLDKCRCPVCCAALTAYNRRRAMAVTAGTWQPWVDAEPARTHVRLLRTQGLGSRRIAELAGLDRKAVTVLLNGRTDRSTPPPAKIRQATAAALLAVSVADGPADHAVIPATVTLRRIHALVAHGWPQARIAAYLGMRESNFAVLLARTTTTPATARAVAALYAQLSTEDPRNGGVSAVSYRRSRSQGQARGWAPPHCWDDDTLDDPGAHPEWTGECGTRAGYRIHQRDAIPACTPCREAEAEHRRTKRRAALAAVP